MSLSTEQIVKFLKFLGGENPGPVGNWVTCKCPLAYWTHKSQKDGTPSFGVNVNSGKFNCFACLSGSLEDLLGTLELYTSQNPHPFKKFDFAGARAALEGLGIGEEDLPEYGLVKNLEEFFPWSDYWLETFAKVSASEDASHYLEKRLVTPEVAAEFDLRWDSKRRMVVAPFRNVWGQLAGARGRCIDQFTPGLKHFDYTFHDHNNSAMVLFNEHVIAEAVAKHRPVVVVEGQFDAMAVRKVYKYVVANLTAKPTPAKLATLNNCPDGVLMMLDNDETGDKAREKWFRGLNVPCGAVDYPREYKDPGGTPHMFLQQALSGLLEEDI